MTIKILGGLANGRSLFVPGGGQTRPTAVRLRRRIFDSYQNLGDWHFVDLCAGSGSVGFEAWSRGAASVTFVESHKQARQTITKNISNFRDFYPVEVAERPLELTRGKAQQWRLAESEAANTIVFLDPPYEEKKIYQDVALPLLEQGSVGELWIESDRQKGFDQKHWGELGHPPDKVFEQGTSYIAIFRFQS